MKRRYKILVNQTVDGEESLCVKGHVVAQALTFEHGAAVFRNYPEFGPPYVVKAIQSWGWDEIVDEGLE